MSLPPLAVSVSPVPPMKIIWPPLLSPTVVLLAVMTGVVSLAAITMAGGVVPVPPLPVPPVPVLPVPVPPVPVPPVPVPEVMPIVFSVSTPAWSHTSTVTDPLGLLPV